MSKKDKEKEVVIDAEDEKETVEVDLEATGLKPRKRGNGGDLNGQVDDLNTRLDDLEDEKEEIVRRISMAIGDSKLAMENADRSLKDVKRLKRDSEKQVKEAWEKIARFEEEIDKIKEEARKAGEVTSRLGDMDGAVGVLGDRVEALENVIESEIREQMKDMGKALKLEDLEGVSQFKEEMEETRKSSVEKIRTIEDRIEELKGTLSINLGDMEQRFLNLQGDITEKISAFEGKIDESLAERISHFEKKMEDMEGMGKLPEEFKTATDEIKKDIEELKSSNVKLEEALGKIEQIERVSTDNKDKIEQIEKVSTDNKDKMGEMLQSVGKLEDEFKKVSEEYEEKIQKTAREVESLIKDRIQGIDSSLDELKAKLEKELTEKLEPLESQVKTISGDFDEKLEPFRLEIDEAKSHLEKELMKVKESWEKLDAAVSDSNGAMVIAQKAKESLQRMEEEIATAMAKLDVLINNISENTLKTDSNKDKVDLTIKLIDEARERIKGIHVPPAAAVAAAVPGLPAMEEEIIFTHDELNEDIDTSDLGFELDDLLQVMIKHEASDLHIKSGSPPTVRMDGELIPVGSQILDDHACKMLVLSCMSPYQRRQLGKRHEVDFAYAIPDARFRVNAFLQKQSVSASFRLLRTDIPTVEEMSLPPVLKKLCDCNHGLVLITGPAGSGKSTTLATMINYINENKKLHIITIEDPIEFIHSDKMSIITQREVGTDTESFAVALKQALRQDPNVVLIGEMRDPETIMTAVIAAETGHLVLSTLHTPNTIQAINRIIDVFSGDIQKQFRLLLSNTLKGVVSQRLLTRADEQGRIPAVEVMVVTPTISSLILEEKTNDIYNHMVEGTTEGMQTFTHALTDLYDKGLVSKEEAMYHADQPTEFRLSIEGHTTGSSAVQEDNLMSWL